MKKKKKFFIFTSLPPTCPSSWGFPYKKKKIFQQTKVQDQMASQANSIKHLEKS